MLTDNLPIPIEDRQLGDKRPITIYSTTDGTAEDPTGANIAGYDSKKHTPGTATSDGAADGTTIVASALTGANDKWNGIRIRVHCAASGESYVTRITDWVLSTTTLTILALPEQVMEDDIFEILGDPIMEFAAADTVTGNAVTTNTTEAMHTYAGERIVAVEFTYSVNWKEWRDFSYAVMGG